MGRFLRVVGLGSLVFACLLTGAGARAQSAEIHVCVRPPDVPVNVHRWALSPGGKVFTPSQATFQQKTRGLTVYVFDPSAPPASVRHLPAPYNQMKCGVSLPVAPAAPTRPSAPEAPVGVPGPESRPGTLPTPTSLPQRTPPPEEVTLPQASETRWLPQANGGPSLPQPWETSWLPVAKSSSGGGGKDVSLAQLIAHEAALAGAIANLQMNENIQRPDGSPYGIPTGKNATGPKNPIVQFLAGAVMVGAAVVTAGADGFRKKLAQALKDGKAIPYKEMANLSSEVADQLAKALGPQAASSGGEAAVRQMMAEALHQTGTIGPYKVMRQFTDKLGAQFQAHHILEVKMFKKFNLGNSDLGPSVLLNDAEHKLMSWKLKQQTASVETTDQLWQAYQKVYVDKPQWLEAIKSYFVKQK